MTPDPKALVEARERVTKLQERLAHGGVGENARMPTKEQLDDAAALALLLAAPAPPPKDGPALDRVLRALEEAHACLWIPTAEQLDPESHARFVAARDQVREARRLAARDGLNAPCCWGGVDGACS